MSGVNAVAVTGEIVTGTSTKTLVQIIAAANHRVLVDYIAVSFKGVVPTDAPILVEVLRQSTAGTMSALTPKKLNDADDETLQTTAQHTASGEPTAGDILFSAEVHPQGSKVWHMPMHKRLVVKGGGRLGVRVTAGVSTSAVAEIGFEE